MDRKIVIALLFVFFPLFLIAGTVGKISGKVVDKQTGEPLVGVNILVKGTTMGAATGFDGRYYILDVPPGLYEVEASYIGYTTMTIKNVRVSVDLTTDLDFALEVEAIRGQEVTVIAKRPIIEKSATNERRVVRSEDIENLPVRGFTDIAALQTGVVKVGNALHIRGGRTEEVAFYVDGVYQVNAYDLSQAGDVSDNALEEVSYQAGGFGAEYGSANAGIVSLATKTGGNKFKISGEVISDEFLSETDPFWNTYSYGYNLYNLSVGGPLTSKIRYYLNAEKQFQRDRRTSAGSHPEGRWTGDKDNDGLKDYDEYEWWSSQGPLPNNHTSKWIGSGNLLLDYKPLKIKIGGNYTFEKRREYVHAYSVFNAENNPKNELTTYSLYARGTYTLNPKTLLNVQANYFFDGYERGNHKYWDDFLKYGIRELPLNLYEDIFGGSVSDTSKIDYYPSGDDIIMVVNPYLPSNGTNPTALDRYARFSAPGSVYDDYSKNETSYIGFNGDLKTQIGFHELKLGGEYRQNTIRYYRIAAPIRLASSYLNNLPYSSVEFDSLQNIDSPYIKDFSTYADYLDNYWFNNYKNAYAENMGFTYDGKSYVNDKLEDNRDAPRRPIIAGFYVQDKVELEDLTMNLGLRYDYIAPNNLKFRDPKLIVIDDQGQISEKVYLDEKGEYSSPIPTYDLDTNAPIDTVGIDQLVQAKTHKIVSPRIGFAFPVTDRTVFHAQYGKYVQQPELNRLFVSYIRFAANLQQGNFTISGNPALDPVKTTAYEIGFRQQIAGNASIDMTVFYKQLTGYVQVRNVANASPVIYATYVNGDYGTVKGLSFSFNLRRTGRVQAVANYTLQYAGGTGSTANGQYRIAWQSGNYPTFVTPLDFDQRHTGSINLDFRTTEQDAIGKAGANILFTFGSGRRYTPSAIDSEVFPAISDHPIAALNSGTMPWVFQVDLKLDKTFNFGNTEFQVYCWIQNLFDKDNVRDVFRGTGLPDYDGWFSTEAGKIWKSNPNNNADLYLMRMRTPFNYETPRTVRLGIRFNL